MRAFCQSLEARTLLSGNIGSVTADYEAVVGDAGALKADLTAAALTYKADAKLIATDIKALGKNKTNSVDIGKLNKAVATSIALDSKATAKLIAVGKAAINRAKAAFLADIKHPTAGNALKLSKSLTALTTALAPSELTLGTDTAAGDAKVGAALSALVSANPTDTTLATDVSIAETNSSTALATLAAEVVNTNNDINTLAAAIS